MNLNKVFLIGRLTADPVLRSTTTGQQVASFSIATNRVWNDKAGARQEETEYHNIVAWGRQAEVANQFLKKGAMVFIEGRLKTRTWQDQQGQNRKTTDIICERMQLGPRPMGSGATGGFQRNNSQQQSPDSQQSINQNQDIKEELPEINLDEEDIKPEDLPF